MCYILSISRQGDEYCAEGSSLSDTARAQESRLDFMEEVSYTNEELGKILFYGKCKMDNQQFVQPGATADSTMRTGRTSNRKFHLEKMALISVPRLKHQDYSVTIYPLRRDVRIKSPHETGDQTRPCTPFWKVTAVSQCIE